MKQSILNMTDWYRYTEAMTNKLSRKFKPFDIDVQVIKDTISRNQQRYIYGVIYPRLKKAKKTRLAATLRTYFNLLHAWDATSPGITIF